MDSPLKKINFESAGKENAPFETDATLVDDIEAKKPIVEQVKTEEKAVVVSSTIKPEEADEPLLQDNPQRFVLFPIKYHEVCIAFYPRVTRKVFSQWLTFLFCRYGTCTRRHRHLSGLPKRLICQKIFTIGTTSSTMTNDTSFPMFSHSSPRQTELSTRTLSSASVARSRFPRLAASTASKL